MVKRLEAMPLGNAGARDMLDRWDRLRIRLEDFEGPVDLTANVSPDAATRAAAESCESKTTRFETELYQNGALYARIKALTARTGPAAKMRKDLLDTFEDNGAALAPDKRARLKAIADRLEEIRQEFDRDIRDNQTRVVFSPDEVTGLPQDYLDKAKRDDKGNYLLGFEYPEYLPFMANAENEEARRRYQFAFQNRGTPRNIELLAEAMRLRKEMAGLFGLSSYAEFATRRRMVANPQTVDKFLRDVKSAVREVERREIAELTALKAATLHKPVGEVRLQRWDADYYQEQQRKARFSVDQEALRKYFPTEASIQWVMAISSRLYGVRFAPATVPTWHPDVRYFDVFDAATGKLKGGIYIDPFPRAGKFSHAAAWPVRSSAKRSRRTPVSALVANLNQAGLDQRRARDAGARVRSRDARRPLRHPVRDLGRHVGATRFRRGAVADVRGMGKAPRIAGAAAAILQAGLPGDRRSAAQAAFGGAAVRRRHALFAPASVRRLRHGGERRDRSRSAGAVGKNGR